MSDTTKQTTTPITARELRDELQAAGIEISMRTAYAIMQGRIRLSVDKLHALGKRRPELATWGMVAWFADRGPVGRHGPRDQCGGA